MNVNRLSIFPARRLTGRVRTQLFTAPPNTERSSSDDAAGADIGLEPAGAGRNHTWPQNPPVERLYDAPVGSTRPEREIARARATYLAAARNFLSAVALYVQTGVPLSPPSGGAELPAWGRAEVTALLTLRAALDE